eukprot:4383197-Prymnesium_polylepis.1
MHQYWRDAIVLRDLGLGYVVHSGMSERDSFIRSAGTRRRATQLGPGVRASAVRKHGDSNSPTAEFGVDRDCFRPQQTSWPRKLR